ncbi:putative F-box domain-containing protein [Helianthus debilis subsp. tardiflorus]
MSDNIPFEIQVEIMKRLPVKPLIQFRSVSKAWKSMIDSSRFIADYSSHVQHLFVSYDNQVGRNVERKYVSILDNDSFPQHRVSPTLPPLVNNLKYPIIIGSSHGLLCLECIYHDGPFPGKEVAVIWNPSIRKAVAVVLPNLGEYVSATLLGFGVCGETCDPKIVKIKHIGWRKDMESIPDSIPRQVEVFTLSAGAWRTPYGSNLPRTSIRFRYPNVVIDGFLYWLVTERITVDGGLEDYNLIISFDITGEEFKEVNLPDSLAHLDHMKLSMSKLRESLVVIENNAEAYSPVSIVWMMEGGVEKSFTKLFNIYTPAASGLLEVRGSTKRGQLITEVVEHPYIPLDDAPLVVYEPESRHINSLGITGTSSAFFVHCYEERLLLLDHPDFIIYNNDKGYIFKPES